MLPPMTLLVAIVENIKMKSYPSILNSSQGPHEDCHVFVKYDGSNIRAEWSKKRGWYKFGTRNELLDRTNPIFGPAVDLFLEKYGDSLPLVFKKEKEFRNCDNIIVFSEWFGAKSFAGMHKPDDPKNIVLFDVNPIKKGFLCAKDFLKFFGHLDVVELLAMRRFGNLLVKEVREGAFGCSSKYEIRNEIPEGVVCKGGSGHKLWMAKIKTQQYYDKLKETYQDNWVKYWE
jgi:hypothetical protein